MVTMMMMMILVRFVSIFPAISRMVCAHCDSESHHTGHSVCTKYCTPHKERGHRQNEQEGKFRVCNECDDCGSTTHKSALSLACSDHKCTNCEGTLEPKGHN
jgi:hypothetical protein